MKKVTSTVLTAAAAAALMTGIVHAEDVVYGTMKIPYDAFYSQEGVAYEVDAVSSATESKWFSDSLVAGTYSEAHTEDDGGDILGVIYPVAISQEDADAIGDQYDFEQTDEIPAAYKQVSVEDGSAVFSAVFGETSAVDASAVLLTETVWGDYEIDIDAIHNDEGNSDVGVIAGVLLTTEDETVYAMRHLENIWRDELSWSSGIYTVEPHGNEMSYENFVDLMGKTIKKITFITETGYHELETDLYVPIKFVGGVDVESTTADAQSTTVTLDGFPEDYAAQYSVSGLEGDVADGSLTWTQALAGAYTMTVSDSNGVYADVLADFVLSTQELPVAYDADSQSLVPAEGFQDEEAAAFIANLASVSVNDTEYAASGRGAVVIIDSDGWVDPEAAISEGRGDDAVVTPIFPESGDYTITAAATGFDTPITFTVSIEK